MGVKKRGIKIPLIQSDFDFSVHLRLKPLCEPNNIRVNEG